MNGNIDGGSRRGFGSGFSFGEELVLEQDDNGR